KSNDAGSKPAPTPPPTSGSAAGSAATTTATTPTTTEKPAPVGAVGVLLNTPKTKTSLHCRSPLCPGEILYYEGTTVTTTVATEPGVTLRVPGATLKNGDTWKIDLMDALARAKSPPEEATSSEVDYWIDVEVVRDGKVQKEQVVMDISVFAG